MLVENKRRFVLFPIKYEKVRGRWRRDAAANSQARPLPVGL